MRTRRSRFAALAAALLALPLLTGCSIASQFLPGNPLELLPGNSVPSTFPSDVPLIDGDVLLGATVPGGSGGSGWNVTIGVSGVEAYDTIVTQMQDAGFTVEELPAVAGARSGAFTKNPYSVIVLVSSVNGAWNANYTVTDLAGKR